MKKILMLGKPGGTLARTYEWHITALNNDEESRFKIDCIHQLEGKVNISEYDIFWFYAKAFQPNLYQHVKALRPDSTIICGPNILLDKPDVGLSDDWDAWYANDCKPDIHLDQVEFYSNHVKKFLNEDTKKVATVLDKCMKLDDSLYDKNCTKEFECLLYSKKRRYDSKFEDFRLNLIDLLEENKIKYCEIPAGKFGSYERKDYFNLLNKSKVMINLSLDECPGILNYESMLFNVPVIGSNHNLPVTPYDDLVVADSDFMTDHYLVRKDDAHQKYFEKLNYYLKNKDKFIKEELREWALNHTSYKRYVENVVDLLS